MFEISKISMDLNFLDIRLNATSFRSASYKYLQLSRFLGYPNLLVPLLDLEKKRLRLTFRPKVT